MRRWSRVLLLPLFGLLGASCGSQDEVARIVSPSGDTEAVVVETNGGATTAFGHNVYVVARGRSTLWGAKVAQFYEASRSKRAAGVNPRWVTPDLLRIEYLDANRDELLPGQPFTVGGRSVRVTLARGVNDPVACAGGMLYALQMSNLNGPECRITGR